MVGQERFCRLVSEHLKKWDVYIECSSELLSLQQHEDHVTAAIMKDGHSEDIEADYVFGADGGKSTSALFIDSALFRRILLFFRHCTQGSRV